MTRVLPNGTKIYASGKIYKPVPLHERKNAIKKPDDPRAVRFGNDWFLPLELAPDEQRVLPETRPDTTAYDHMAKKRVCRCEVCQRPEAQRWKQKWIRDQYH